MSDGTMMVAALIFGLLLGRFFFAGLRWTTALGLAAQRPHLWFLGSFFIRFGVVALFFALLSWGDAYLVALSAAGFRAAQLSILSPDET